VKRREEKRRDETRSEEKRRRDETRREKRSEETRRENPIPPKFLRKRQRPRALYPPFSISTVVEGVHIDC